MTTALSNGEVQKHENRGGGSIKQAKSKSRIDDLEHRVEANPFDLEDWSQLFKAVKATKNVDYNRQIHERFLAHFPTSTRHWLSYLELELQNDNYEAVEALFTRCLKDVLSVDIWKFYLSYIRRINSDQRGAIRNPESRQVVEKAYEYVLANVGVDHEAGAIWADYIQFLKAGETSSTWEEQRKMDTLRRVFQRAIGIPVANVEQLWKDYDQWENGLNKLTAKKYLAERSAGYMTARTALRELNTLTENIKRNVVPIPPKWTSGEIEQLTQWKRYLAWEKSNPLSAEDTPAIVERVIYAYRQALLCLRFYPEIWYEYALYCKDMSNTEQALAVLKQATEVLPSSLLVNFAYAEMCETEKQFEDAKQVYEKLTDTIRQDIDKAAAAADESIKQVATRIAEEKAKRDDPQLDGETRAELRAAEQEREKEKATLEEEKKETIDDLSRGLALVWINHMQFTRRTEGINKARAVFSKARKSPHTSSAVFIASALMEFYNTKDPVVAGKIFEFGLKTFGFEVPYVLVYLDYLMQLNDDTNTRALFERALATIPADQAKPIWDKLVEYETRYSDLASAQKIQKRRAEVYPEETDLERLAFRFSYFDIDVITEKELGGKDRDLSLGDMSSVTGILDLDDQKMGAKGKGKQKNRNLLLEPVHSTKFARPNLELWPEYTPSEEVIPRKVQEEPIASQNALTPTLAPPPAWQGVPMPEAIAAFLASLPPAQHFTGPFIPTEDVINLIHSMQLPPIIKKGGKRTGVEDPFRPYKRPR